MLKITPLLHLSQTAREMRRLAETYAGDMLPYVGLTPTELFSLISSLPYIPDPEGVEFLKRPAYTLSGMGPGGDCDDKAIAVAAWAVLRHYPYRFVGVSRSVGKPLHHVFAEVSVSGSFIPFDCTYAINVPFQVHPYPVREVLR